MPAPLFNVLKIAHFKFNWGVSGSYSINLFKLRSIDWSVFLFFPCKIGFCISHNTQQDDINCLGVFTF
jgi:hypothetical protein